MTSCRGILVAGVTNVARTQIAEGLLRSLTAGRVFVKSGGVHHCAAVHPLAIEVMREVGVDMASQSVSSLDSARRQRGTYDVYVSIDAPYANRTADRFQRPAPLEGSSSSLYGDPLLAPPLPAHWEYAADATDVRQQWNIWSPRDPAVFYENSTRKFQDFLYEGEPLFMRLKPSRLRLSAKISERWEMQDVAERYALETRAQQRRRFRDARNELAQRSLALLRRLEEHYGEELVTNTKLLQTLSSDSATS